MRPKRAKRMTLDEFQSVFDRNWTRVDMTLTLPDWMKAVPVVQCLASGSNVQPVNTTVEGRLFSEAVGGIDVFRHDPQDVQYGGTYNKDHYVIMRDKHDNMLLVFGPYRDDEHWVAAIPTKYHGVETLLPPRQGEEQE